MGMNGRGIGMESSFLYLDNIFSRGMILSESSKYENSVALERKMMLLREI